MTTREKAHDSLVCDNCGTAIETSIHFPFWAAKLAPGETRFDHNAYSQPMKPFNKKYSDVSKMSLDLCQNCFTSLKKSFYLKKIFPRTLFFYLPIMFFIVFIYVGNSQIDAFRAKMIGSSLEEVAQQNRNILTIGIAVSAVYLILLLISFIRWKKPEPLKNRFFLAIFNNFNGIVLGKLNFIYCELRPLAINKAFDSRRTVVWTDPEYRNLTRNLDGTTRTVEFGFRQTPNDPNVIEINIEQIQAIGLGTNNMEGTLEVFGTTDNIMVLIFNVLNSVHPTLAKDVRARMAEGMQNPTRSIPLSDPSHWVLDRYQGEEHDNELLPLVSKIEGPSATGHIFQYITISPKGSNTLIRLTLILSMGGKNPLDIMFIDPGAAGKAKLVPA